MPEDIVTTEVTTTEVTPEPKKEPAKAAPPAPEPKKDPELTELSADSDEIPENDALFKLSKSALAKRLDRHTKKELRERFGTDDMSKISADLAELATLRAEKDEQRRKTLSNEQRLQEDIEREKKKAEELTEQLQAERDARVFEGYDQTTESALAAHIDPEAIELATAKFKKHVLSFDDDDVELKDPKKLAEDFAKEYAKKNPKFAKDANAPEPKKVPLTTGGGGGAKRPDARNADLTARTPKPGQVNSMSKAEFAAYKRSKGL